VAFVDTTDSTEVKAVNSVQALDIAVGGETSRGYGCVILVSHEILCWGDNAPISGIVPGINNAIDVSAGVGHTCAVLRDGTLKCWGANGSGQLGDGTQITRSSPVAVRSVGGTGTLSNIVEVFASAKRDITCALSSAGRVMCWGNNSHGAIGNSSVGFGTSVSSPVFVEELSSGNPITDVKTIAVGTYATCAIKISGATFCWGDNGLGQLGSPSNGSTNAAVPVAGVGGTGTLSDATQVALGDAMGCARRSNGLVACWGMNYLGTGSSGGSSSPVTVSGITNAVQVATAEENACVLLATGAVTCWGNWHGNGGSGATQQVFPASVSPGAPILTNARKLATGGGWPQKYCAILNDDTVRCWGANDSGSLGVSSGSVPYSNVPVEPQQTFSMGPVTTSTTTTTTTTTSSTSTTSTTVAPAVSSSTVPSVNAGGSSAATPSTVAQGQKFVPRVVPTTVPVVPPVVATTTTVPADVVSEDAPEPAEVSGGEGVLVKNGKSQQVEVTRESNQVVMRAGQQSATISVLDADEKIVSLNEDGTIDISDAEFVEVKLAGFTPGDSYSVWMFSTATKLGESQVGSDGAVTGRFELPFDIDAGSHRLVVEVGIQSDDVSRFTLGVTHSGQNDSGIVSRILIGVPIALAVFFGLLIPNQIRRRRRQRLA
jgi:hypothetical protein